MRFPNMQPELKMFFQSLEVWEDNFVFDHFELEWLASIGATYTVVSGMWNDTTNPLVNIDFPESMMVSDETIGPPPRPKIYQTWAGTTAYRRQQQERG